MGRHRGAESRQHLRGPVVGWAMTMMSTANTSRIRSGVINCAGVPEAATLPDAMKCRRSQTAAARLRSCRTTSTPTSRSRSMPRSRTWCARSRWFVGSSRTRKSGSCTSARAMSALWRSPPDSPVMPRCRRCPIPMSAMARSHRSRSRGPRRPPPECGTLPIATVSSTVKSKSEVDCWDSAAMRRAESRKLIVSTSAPSTRTAPRVGRSARYTVRRIVDFPQPFGPIRPTTSPRPSDSEIPSTMGRPSRSTPRWSMAREGWATVMRRAPPRGGGAAR